MIPGFEQIVEERIRRAQKSGHFDNLDGAGRPLPQSTDPAVPEDLRLAYKVLKNAGFVPPEIQMKKEIHRIASILADMPDTAEAYMLLKRLNVLVMQINTLRPGRVELEVPQQYNSRLVARFSKRHHHEPCPCPEAD